MTDEQQGLYALWRMNITATLTKELNTEAFSGSHGPRCCIVTPLCESSNQRFAVTCKGDIPFPFQVPKINQDLERRLGTEMQEIEFYCRKCRGSMHMSMLPTGHSEAIVMNGIILKCHRCKKASTLKNMTEGMIVARSDKQNKLYI